MQDKINFKLENPIKVQANIDGKNQFIDLDNIYLVAPSYKQKDKTIALKKKFIEAIFGMTQSLSKQEASEQIDNDKGLDSKAIKAILYASPNFDIVQFFKLFENLLINVAFKDDNISQNLTSLDIEKISEDDFEELLAKYIEVFTIASWMRTLK